MVWYEIRVIMLYLDMM